MENCKHAVPPSGISFDNWWFDSNYLQSSARYLIMCFFHLNKGSLIHTSLFFLFYFKFLLFIL